VAPGAHPASSARGALRYPGGDHEPDGQGKHRHPCGLWSLRAKGAQGAARVGPRRQRVRSGKPAVAFVPTLRFSQAEGTGKDRRTSHAQARQGPASMVRRSVQLRKGGMFTQPYQGDLPGIAKKHHIRVYVPSAADNSSAISPMRAKRADPAESTCCTKRSKSAIRWPRPMTCGCMVTVRTPRCSCSII
jgi:hypothetical protein